MTREYTDGFLESPFSVIQDSGKSFIVSLIHAVDYVCDSFSVLISASPDIRVPELIAAQLGSAFLNPTISRDARESSSIHLLLSTLAYRGPPPHISQRLVSSLVLSFASGEKGNLWGILGHRQHKTSLAQYSNHPDHLLNMLFNLVAGIGKNMRAVRSISLYLGIKG